MSIGDDFTIDTSSKVIRHSSGTTVYSVADWYSWLMDTFDEPAYMSYQNPLKYNTPTSYTMLNGWFLDNGDGSNILQYLTGGSIDTENYDTVADPVYILDVDTIGADFVAGDKGLNLTDDATPVGPVLAYINNYGGTADHNRVWVRDTRGTPATIADSSTIAVSGGTGAGTANGDSINGNEVYANIYTIASFAGTPDPQVYIFQVHPDTGISTRIAEWSAFTNWDRGSIDILIPVKLGGVAIDSGNIKVFVRQTGDTFTHTEGQVSTASGTRTPIATETASDTVNITKGEYYMFYDGGTSPSISAGNIIQDTATDSGTPPTWYAEVVSHTAWDTATGVLVLRGLRGTPADNDNIYVGTSDTTANVNGSIGDTFVTYDAESTGPAGGDLGKVFSGGTSGASRILRSYQDDGSSGKLLFQVYHTHGTIDSVDFTGTARDALYKDFADNDVVTADGAGTMNVTLSAASVTLISGYSDVSILHINGTCTCSNPSGTFIPGERVTWNAGSSAAFVVKASAVSITLANVDSSDEPDNADTFTGDLSGATLDCDSGLSDDNTETFAFPLQTAYDYTVFVECGEIYNTGRDLDDVYAYMQFRCRDGDTDVFYTSDGSSITEIQGQAYIKAVAAYSANKNAPFGSLAGGVLFGARGVWVEGMASGDANHIKLTDHNNNLREPYTSVNVSVTNTRVGDDIAVYLEDGSTGLPDKDQYTGHASNNSQSDSTFEQNAAGGGFPNDTPSSGCVVVVATDEKVEHRYRYTSWDNTGGDGDDGKLTLATEVSGTAEGGTSGQTLVDTGVFASGVERGDIIRNTTDASVGYVLSVDSANQITTTIMHADSGAGAAVPWEVGDGFEINSLVQNYDDSDTFFIPYINVIEDTGTELSPGSETVTLTFVTNRSVVIRVRNVSGVIPIQPFITTSDITIAGMTVAVIRNPDQVYA